MRIVLDFMYMVVMMLRMRRKKPDIGVSGGPGKTNTALIKYLSHAMNAASTIFFNSLCQEIRRGARALRYAFINWRDTDGITPRY